VTFISLLAAALRLVRITFPNSRVFDEVYSPVFAWKWLHGQEYFDIHPLLAELPHSIGLLLFGDTPLGWRLAPWISGIVFCWAGAYVGYLLSNRRITGVLVALLISLDTAYFVYGRTGLPDMFLLSQVALSIVFFLLSARTRGKKALFAAILSGVFIGNVISTKWLGLAILGVIWSSILIFGFVRLAQKRGRPLKTSLLLPRINKLLYPILFLALPLLIYFLWLIPMVGWQGTMTATWAKIIWWHQSVWNYNTTLTATHPYSSTWWQWPLVIRPVLFYWQQTNGGREIINATGNVFLWWSTFVVLIGALLSLFRKFRPVLLWLVVSSLGFWLPWGVISRIAFNYHYFEALFFEILIMALLLTKLIRSKDYRAYAIAYIVLLFIGFIALYPSITGINVPYSFASMRFFLPY